MIRADILIAAAVLAVVGAVGFAIEHPRESLFIFAGSFAVRLIAVDLWRARHKIAAALRG